MKSNYDVAFEHVVGSEGGFQDDRHDRGNWTSGKVGVGQRRGTKYGITAMNYPEYDIRNLTQRQAKDIYKTDYWDKCLCDDLPVGIDYAVFDIAVNHGVGDGIRFLQEAVGTTVDGIVGPNTIAAVKNDSPLSTIGALIRIRQYDYTNLGTWNRYGKGWSRRNANVAEEALVMMEESLLDQSNKSSDKTSFFGLFKRTT